MQSVRSQRQFEVQQRRQRANELQDWIAASIDAGVETDLGEAFDELESLGAEDVSLALKAHRAMRAGDLLLELELRHRLAQLLPCDSVEAQPSHDRYIALLLDFGQYEAALEAMNQSGQASIGRATECRPPWLSVVIDAMHTGQDVIFADPDRSARIDQIIAAARIVNRPLWGLWELHRSRRILMPDTVVPPGQLAIAIENCNHDTFGFGIRTCASRVLWVENGAALPSEVVVSSPHWDESCEHFKVLLRTTPTPGGTELTRSIVLAPGVSESSSGDPVRSCELFENIAAVKEQGGRAAILAPLNKLIHRTLQGLRSAAVFRGSYGSGGAL